LLKNTHQSRHKNTREILAFWSHTQQQQTQKASPATRCRSSTKSDDKMALATMTWCLFSGQTRRTVMLKDTSYKEYRCNTTGHKAQDCQQRYKPTVLPPFVICMGFKCVQQDKIKPQ